MNRCTHCGGNLVPDGAYFEGQKDEYFKCLQCGRRPDEMKVLPTKKCERCKADFEPTGNSQKFCESCRKQAKIERTKKWRDKTREIVKAAKEEKPAPEVRPAVSSILNFFSPEARTAIIEDCQKQAAKEIIQHIQATFLEG